ncbi:hypothetical protein BC834DRAFT_966796 [Gloeopeniophorella convolvens]|nr:hypothetical protein BC834DRAFT_966796 [Gloeopeniophorella convolvens]
MAFITAPPANCHFLTNDPADIAAVAKMLVDVFCQREPMTRQLMRQDPTLTREAMTTLSTELARQCADWGFSPVVKVGGNIISFVLAGPYEPAPPASAAPRGLEPIYDVLHKLSQQFEAYAATRTDRPKFIEWMVSAVDERYQGHQTLILTTQLTMKKANATGFTDIVVKTTSHTQSIAEKHGFKTVGTVSYLTHEYNGKRHFAGVGPHEVKQARVQVSDSDTFWRAQCEIDAALQRGAKL